jgi:glycosyltransferase involved in cell wall biosynthesis/SAM-dependent methyltransferase
VSQYSHLTADLSNPNSPVTKLARLVGRDRVVLDVGCAHGYVAQALRAQGCRVFGIELDEDDALRAQEHCEQVVVGSVEDRGWTEALRVREFDAMVFSDVLEHLRDPAEVLRRCRPLLVPGRGFIAASVPNVAHVSVRLELLLGSFRAEPLGILDATHLHFYTRDSLGELFASCGFEVEAWDCTTNEIAAHVIAEHLARAGLPYTPELAERFAAFDAMAYQFIVTARPSAAPRPAAPAPVHKPLRMMEELIRDHRQLRTAPEALAEPGPGGLRVLQVIHQFVPRHAAGTEIYCSDLSFALARRGHAVRVLSAAPHRDDVGIATQWEDDTGIVVERVPATRAYRLLGSVGGFLDRFDNPDAHQAIRAVLGQMRPDVVHIQHLLHLSAQLIPECRNRGIPVVATLADYWFICHRVRLELPDGTVCEGPRRGWNCCGCLKTSRLVRSRLNPAAVGANLYRYEYLIRQLNKVDRILAPSAFLREKMIANGVEPDRIVVCDYGTVVPPAAVEDLLAVPRPREPVRFGYLGSLMRHKGVHLLIEAMNRMPPGRAELHVFGAAPEPEYGRAIEHAARHDGVRWRGAVAHPDRWRALSEMDVMIVPSIWYENSPLTIHEALMARVPVIGSEMGGIPEHVHHGVNGLVYPAFDVEALAAAMRRVVDEPQTVRRWQEAIVPPKPMSVHVDEIEALYRSLLADRSAVPA